MSHQLPKTLTVKVTQRDINLGVRTSAGQCPISIAIKRDLNKRGFGISHVSTIQINAIVFQDEERTQQRYDFPARVVDWIDQYDNGGRGSPIQFQARAHEA